MTYRDIPSKSPAVRAFRIQLYCIACVVSLTPAVSKFEAELIACMRDKHGGLLKTIVEKGALDEESTGRLSAAIAEFKKGFKP